MLGAVTATACLVEKQSSGVDVDSVALGLAGVVVDSVVGPAGLFGWDVQVADGLAVSSVEHVLGLVVLHLLDGGKENS